MDEADDVVRMVRGAWVSLCLRAACELGIFDALEEPRTLVDLAERTSSDTAWTHLSDAVRRGAPVYQELYGMTSWELLASHPDDEVVFNAAMARRSAIQVAAIREAWDFATTRLVIDVGGGEGAMLAGLLSEEPHLQGIVADRSAVALAATEALAASGVGRSSPRTAVGLLHGGAARRRPPPTVQRRARLGRHPGDVDPAHRSRRDGSRRPPAPVENVLDAPGRTAPQQRDLHLIDLHMLVMFGARERTKAEYDSLLVGAGFARSWLSPSPSAWNVLRTQRAS